MTHDPQLQPLGTSVATERWRLGLGASVPSSWVMQLAFEAILLSSNLVVGSLIQEIRIYIYVIYILYNNECLHTTYSYTYLYIIDINRSSSTVCDEVIRLSNMHIARSFCPAQTKLKKSNQVVLVVFLFSWMIQLEILYASTTNMHIPLKKNRHAIPNKSKPPHCMCGFCQHMLMVGLDQVQDSSGNLRKPQILRLQRFHAPQCNMFSKNTQNGLRLLSRSLL